MEHYYCVEMNGDGTWRVTLWNRKIIGEFESAEFACDVAEAMNEAYREGQRFAEERIKGKFADFITK
jgi:hypothetical protein